MQKGKRTKARKHLPSGPSVAEKRTTPDGREIWRVSSKGEVVNLVTSSSSAAIMDEAVKIYAGALKRLADK